MLMLFILLSLALGTPQNWWRTSKVLDLTTSNYKEHIGKGKHVVIDFYSPNCHFCHLMFNEWEGVWEYYNSPDSAWFTPNLQITKVNAAAEPLVRAQFNIMVFPTIVFIPAGKDTVSAIFQGNRLKTQFLRWIDEQVSHTVKGSEGIERAVEDLEVLQQKVSEHTENLETHDDSDENSVFAIDLAIETTEGIREEFQSIHVEIQELRSYFLEELSSISGLAASLRTLLKSEGLNTMEKFQSLQEKIETMDFNLRKRNKIESTQTSFNLNHFLVFLTLGTIIGTIIGVLLVSHSSRKCKE